MNEINKLDGIVKAGYSLNVSATFDEILKYFKKTFLLNGIVAFIIYALFIIAIIALVGAIGINFQDLTDETALQRIVLDPNFMVYNLLAGFFMQILVYPIFAGFIQINRDIDTHEEVGIGNIFKIFSSKKYIHVLGFCILSYLLTSVPALVFTTLELPFIATIINYIVTFLLVLGLPLILFSNLNSLQAIKYSALLVLKNPLGILGILLLSLLIAMLGIFGCFIGILFTLPVFFSAQYILYKKIVGFDEEIVFDIEKDNVL